MKKLRKKQNKKLKKPDHDGIGANKAIFSKDPIHWLRRCSVKNRMGLAPYVHCFKMESNY